MLQIAHEKTHEELELELLQFRVQELELATRFYQLGSEIKFYGLFNWDGPEIISFGLSD